MIQSDTIGVVLPAMHEFSKRIKGVGRDRENTYHHSRYTTWEKIREAIATHLEACELQIVHAPTVLGDGSPGIETRVYHVITGEFIGTVHRLHLAKDDPQGLKSAVTYAKRMTTEALLMLTEPDEDDDGNDASGLNGTRPRGRGSDEPYVADDDREAAVEAFASLMGREAAEAKVPDPCTVSKFDELQEEYNRMCEAAEA